LRAVRTRRATREPANGLLAFWTVPVRYGGPTYMLEYDSAVASLPVRKDAAALVRAVDIYENAVSMIAAREHSLRPNGFPARVGSAIAGGAQGQPEVARKLGLSIATLRRRLADSDLSFRAIRARVLGETACALLVERRTVADVADTLGFADSRSFSRAFKAWKGVTPAAFIATLERDPPSREPIA
jgi:AraC-like DNA-binding protein